MASTTVMSLSFILLGLSSLVAGKVGDPQAKHHFAAKVELNVIQSALEDVIGEDERDHLAAAAQALHPMWRTLPKDPQGRVEWRSLRHIAHRYFMQRFGLLVRGFEPARLVNASHSGHAEIFSNHMPHFIDVLLEERRADRWFVVEDAAALVVTLEKLIFESETALLETAYRRELGQLSGRVDRRRLFRILETYMVHWFMSGNDESVNYVLDNPHTLEGFLHWNEMRGFINGQIEAMDFARARSPKARDARSMMLGTYTFDDAHTVVGSITRSFASYWESECRIMKESLVAMDTDGTGRVRLSQFYGAALNNELQFRESEDYLRDQGVLDETSTWRGKQVLVANYMQAASNCIVSSPNYLVCCANECEGILTEIEQNIGMPAALPNDILRVVKNITSPSHEDDTPPVLDGPLAAQLQKLADLHGGVVPLHGRLFSQWLHYVFPRECAFPHKAGTIAVQMTSEFNDDYVATDAQMQETVAAAVSSASNSDSQEVDELRRDSQLWSEEEEVLFAGNAVDLRAPWEAHRSVTTVGGAVAALLVAAWRAISWRKGHDQMLLPVCGNDAWSKSHSV
jgi:hypothetical protein